MYKLHKEIYNNLILYANSKTAERYRKFHKYKINLLGIESLVFKKVLNSFKKEIKNLSCEDVFKIAGFFYNKKIEEITLAGSFILKNRIDCIDKSKLKLLDNFLDNFYSWSTIDNFCIDVLQPLLLKYPQEILLFLKKWNKSKNLWKRRLSVIIFTRKIGISGEFTEEAISLCEKLIWDKEDLVLKGVGWCLKDIIKGDKKKVLKYVKNLREKKVSSVIVLYSIRDLNIKERKNILRI